MIDVLKLQISLITQILIREIQEIDDQNMQKIVTDVIEGKKRTRRRNGGATLDDSESEDEEEENARRRRKMYKRARTVDGHLAALGESLGHPIFGRRNFLNLLQKKTKKLLHLLMDTNMTFRILLNMTLRT